MKIKYSYSVRPDHRVQAYISIPQPEVKDLARVLESVAFLHNRPDFKLEIL